MANVKVFWVERTDRVQVRLRRFTFGSAGTEVQPDHQKCPAREYGHDGEQILHENAPEADWLQWPDHTDYRRTYRQLQNVPHDHPSWPKVCEACGQPFNEHARWQVNSPSLYTGAPDGRLYTLRTLPVGAMWNADWFGKLPAYTGPDGISLVVKLPNGNDWLVDGRASNCTLPNDDVHKCWIRHGDPRTGNVHVDKQGNTCSAGAGSILSGNYHGFLHNGYLVD